MKKVLYAGSFDPITKGHMDIINKTLKLFDKVVIAVLHNSAKKGRFFTKQERVELIRELYKEMPNVKVVLSMDSAIDVAKKEGCIALIRGIRKNSDLDYEMTLAQVNKETSEEEIETVILLADPNYRHISSSLVKELLALNKNIERYVDFRVMNRMLEKHFNKKIQS